MNRNAVSLSRTGRLRGHRREFDMDDALDQAIRIFRERGYNATSIGDLTDAMGLASGSLAGNEAFLAEPIRQGHIDKSIPRQVDPERTARVMVYLTQGMRGVGKAGRSPPDRSSVIEIAMKLVA